MTDALDARAVVLPCERGRFQAMLADLFDSRGDRRVGDLGDRETLRQDMVAAGLQVLQIVPLGLGTFDVTGGSRTGCPKGWAYLARKSVARSAAVDERPQGMAP